MNYIVVNSVCCCLSVCCKQFWQSTYRIVGKQAFIKVAYCLIYYGAVIVSILMAYIMDSSWFWFFKNFAPGIDCFDKDASEQVNCLSFSLLYRVSLSLFIFSIFMLLVLKLCTSRIALILNQTLFFTKFILIMILLLIFVRFDNQFFMKYGQFSKIISYVFVICQQIILIDLAYLWGIKWARIYVEGYQSYAGLLIIVSAVMFGGCIGFTASGFMYHHEQLNWINILSTIQILLMVGIQLLNFNKQNSLLTTSALCLLVSYYTWSAGWSHPLSQPLINTQQNALYNYPSVLIFNLIITIILVIFSTAGSIYGSTNQEQNRLIDLDNPNAQQEQLQHEQRNKWVHWLLFLAGVSAYVAMIFTDWGSADIVKKQFNLTTGAWTSKLLMSTTVFVVYTWTLLAPRLCPHRNFYFQ